MDLYKPVKSSKAGKKMMVKVLKKGKPTLIHFGDSKYRHNYSPEARKSYLARSKGIKDGKGKLTYLNKNSANYWSRKELWNA